MTDFVRKSRPQTPDQPSLFLSLLFPTLPELYLIPGTVDTHGYHGCPSCLPVLFDMDLFGGKKDSRTKYQESGQRLGRPPGDLSHCTCKL